MFEQTLPSSHKMTGLNAIYCGKQDTEHTLETKLMFKISGVDIF
jgi:hypothetical protein